MSSPDGNTRIIRGNDCGISFKQTYQVLTRTYAALSNITHLHRSTQFESHVHIPTQDTVVINELHHYWVYVEDCKSKTPDLIVNKLLSQSTL